MYLPEPRLLLQRSIILFVSHTPTRYVVLWPPEHLHTLILNVLFLPAYLRNFLILRRNYCRETWKYAKRHSALIKHLRAAFRTRVFPRRMYSKWTPRSSIVRTWFNISNVRIDGSMMRSIFLASRLDSIDFSQHYNDIQYYIQIDLKLI